MGGWGGGGGGWGDGGGGGGRCSVKSELWLALCQRYLQVERV